MKNVQVEVGTRGIRPVTERPELKIEDNNFTSGVIQQALNGEGELFYNKNRPNDWILVRNIPELRNNNQEVTKEAIRVEIKFENSLYLLPFSDKEVEISPGVNSNPPVTAWDLKLKKLKSLPMYGTLIRPYSEITKENKVRAQQEAVKILTGMDSESLKGILAQLNSNIEAAKQEEVKVN